MLVSDIPFLCMHPNISITGPLDAVPTVGILKTAVSIWSNSCKATSITANGAYTNFNTNILYGALNNPLDTLCGVGIPEITNTFEIFPNPTRGKLKIKASRSIDPQVRIYDTAGKIITEFQKTDRSNEMTIDISTLKNGIYEIRIGD
jgi:hypothetical protein